MCNKIIVNSKFFFLTFFIFLPCIFLSKTVISDVSKKSAIMHAENWINGIQTLKANFLQTTSHGKVARGQIYIMKPGLMLIDYAPPTKIKIYANQHWIIYVDHELKEVNQIPISGTPAHLLLKKVVRLADEANIMLQEDKNSFRFLLTRKDDPDEGLINLIFSKEPWQLRGWTVIDQQGIKTSFSLLAAQINQPINKKELQYYAPDWAFE
ncbi:MAG: hypothetical protein CMM44_02120 [Rhodospirillaceae bacterium]|nr:hypothetical protein [Rhodospirillaceae bacterium]